MKIKTKNGVLDIPAVWLEQKNPHDPNTWILKGIDQTKLPFKLDFFECANAEDVPRIISQMIVRGAPTIGATAALGLVLAVRDVVAQHETKREAIHSLRTIAEQFLKSRPTAVDLKNGVNAIINAVKNENNLQNWTTSAKEASMDFVSSIVEDGKKIGIQGEKLIHDGQKILTHCNAGPLAHVDYGSALAPILRARTNQKDIFVWVDETRPRLQGSKLTAWELYQNDVPHAIITDNAAAFLMQKGEIDMIIVGADRVVKNGDVANKIGTYGLSVLAKEHDIPFYVAFPISTIDLTLNSGKDIPIEARDPIEVTHIMGWDGTQLRSLNVASPSSSAINYAFDVTPARNITGYITPFGVFSLFEDVIKAAANQGRSLSQ